jgi:hypothetical protein
MTPCSVGAAAASAKTPHPKTTMEHTPSALAATTCRRVSCTSRRRLRAMSVTARRQQRLIAPTWCGLVATSLRRRRPSETAPRRPRSSASPPSARGFYVARSRLIGKLGPPGQVTVAAPRGRYPPPAEARCGFCGDFAQTASGGSRCRYHLFGGAGSSNREVAADGHLQRSNRQSDRWQLRWAGERSRQGQPDGQRNGFVPVREPARSSVPWPESGGGRTGARQSRPWKR